MGFTVHTLPSAEKFTAICTALDNFGKAGFERLRIASGTEGSFPSLASTPGWIERILRFFRFKSKNVRLQDVANFSLDWLRTHAFRFTPEFCKQLPTLQKLRPLMQKAHLAEEFNLLLAQAALINKERIRTDFELQWPNDLPGKDQLEPIVREIISRFLKNPGSTIRRERKTTTISLECPEQAPLKYDLPLKVDFFLEGAIRRRRIIIKTNEVLGRGGERKVLRAYDVLSGQELVSKPFVSPIEKLIVQTFYEHNLAGLTPYCAGNEKRFYETRCQPLLNYLIEPLEARLKMARQLILALDSLHDIVLEQHCITDPEGKEVEIDRLPCYHADIKFPNILVFQNDQSELVAVLSDLGGSSNVAELCYTPFFRSPELTRFAEEKFYPLANMDPLLQFGETLEHNLRFGQSSDVWSLGLVLVALLTGKTLENVPETFRDVGVPALDCFRDHLKRPWTGDRLPIDHWLVKLNQEDIDSSLDKLGSACTFSSDAKKIWNCIKKMLKVNPEERVTIRQACLDLNS